METVRGEVGQTLRVDEPQAVGVGGRGAFVGVDDDEGEVGGGDGGGEEGEG